MNCLPTPGKITEQEKEVVLKEIEEMLKKEAIINNTSETRSRAISKLYFHSSKEIRYFLFGNKPGEAELLCGIQTFQNRGAFLLNEVLEKSDFLCKLNLKDAYFLSTSSQGISKLCKVSKGEKLYQ